MLTLEVLQQLAIQGGTIGSLFFAFFIYGLYKEWWVLGKPWRELLKERNEWRFIALKASKIADKAFTQARRKSQMLEGEKDEDSG